MSTGLNLFKMAAAGFYKRAKQELSLLKAVAIELFKNNKQKMLLGSVGFGLTLMAVRAVQGKPFDVTAGVDSFLGAAIVIAGLEGCKIYRRLKREAYNIG